MDLPGEHLANWPYLYAVFNPLSARAVGRESRAREEFQELLNLEIRLIAEHEGRQAERGKRDFPRAR
jgi:hypothetical protein